MRRQDGYSLMTRDTIGHGTQSVPSTSYLLTLFPQDPYYYLPNPLVEELKVSTPLIAKTSIGLCNEPVPSTNYPQNLFL
jgi:hypothetical protein